MRGPATFIDLTHFMHVFTMVVQREDLRSKSQQVWMNTVYIPPYYNP